MRKINKIIFIKNAVETLGYFSEQMALEMEHCGLDTYFIDYDDLAETIGSLAHFAETGRTALVTFNFIGLSGEDVFLEERGTYLWEKYRMPYLNILVDHPLYYHTKLEMSDERMFVYCIDREHVNYVKRFYPNVQVGFLPLAGNVQMGEKIAFSEETHTYRAERILDYAAIRHYENRLIPYENRKFDLVFTANYVPIEKVSGKMTAQGEEYGRFYRGIFEELIANPVQSIEEVMERHITEELGAVSEADKRAAMSGMQFLDLCVRSYFRGDIIRLLADADIIVHVFGADWERLHCKKPWNIIRNNRMVHSSICVEAIRNARISLNIMPWFKDGAHDRVFTSMLQKTVSLTDDSHYLTRQFTDREDIAFFSLQERKQLPDCIRELLSDPENASRLAENGYQKAIAAHTWFHRSHELLKKLNAL